MSGGDEIVDQLVEAFCIIHKESMAGIFKVFNSRGGNLGFYDLRRGS